MRLEAVSTPADAATPAATRLFVGLKIWYYFRGRVNFDFLGAKFLKQRSKKTLVCLDSIRTALLSSAKCCS